MPPFDQTPDRPEPFGYKVSWFALKAADPASAFDALRLEGAMPANWSSGLAAVYGSPPGDDRWVFLSPPIKGWVLAISGWWPYPTLEPRHDIGTRFDVLFSRAMTRFDDVQFFSSHRVSDFAAWARALNGRPTRLFAYGDGQVLINFGDQTPEEAELGLVNVTGLSLDDAGDAIFDVAQEQDAEEERLVATGLSLPEARARLGQKARDPFPDESDVIALAGLWSIDPTRLSDHDHAPGLGLAARLPDDLSE